jgi:hypothetical protein
MPNPPSSLHALNVAFGAAVADHLVRSLGVELRQSGLSAVNDPVTDMRLLQERSNEPGFQEMPGLVSSRRSIAVELGTRATAQKFAAALESRGDSVNYRLITAGYSSRAYFDDVQQAEYLVERLLLLEHPKFSFTYRFDGIPSSPDLLAVAHITLPGTETKYATRASANQSGEVFQVSFAAEVKALLVDVPQEAKVIESISYTIYDLNQVQAGVGEDFGDMTEGLKQRARMARIILE